VLAWVVDTYKDVHVGVCLDSPLHSSSPTNTSERSDCVCNIVFTANGVGALCAAGTYKISAASAACSPCLKGANSPEGGRHSSDCVKNIEKMQYVVTMQVNLPMFITEFTNDKLSLFKQAIAAAAGVGIKQVQIKIIVSMSQRRSQSITIKVQVAADDGTQALSIVQLLTNNTINDEMYQECTT